jgi:hypothetical protein
MRNDWNDWIFMAAVVFSVVVLFSFAAQRVSIGRVVGGSVASSPDCVTYASSQVVSLSSSLLLCPNTTHQVDYFSVEEDGLVIDCQNSIIQGSGGALFVPRIDNPTITLKDCSTQGFDGLYSALNPLVVRVENRS